MSAQDGDQSPKDIEASDVVEIRDVGGALRFTFDGPNGQTTLRMPLATVDRLMMMLVKLNQAGRGTLLKGVKPQGNA